MKTKMGVGSGKVISTNQHLFNLNKRGKYMKNFSTWLLAIFMVMFWLFRAIVALCTQYSVDMLGIVAYNLNIEIIIAFLTIPCIVFVIRRKLVGSLAYLLIYGLYFGNHLFNGIITMLEGEALTMEVSLNLLSDFVAIILALFVFMDMLVDKSRKANPIDRKTDWYFKNEKYDEELNARDSREDKNQYKFY